MKKIILMISVVGVLFGGCYTQIGTIKEDKGYSSYENKKEYQYYLENYDNDIWFYSRYVYRYYLPYPRYYLFFRYYTPGFAFGLGRWWYYDPFVYDYYWWDWYWWDRYYWYSYWYFSPWYYYPWWYYGAPVIIVTDKFYYSPTGDKRVVYRPRSFGSTRGGRGNESGSITTGEGSSSISPPSRTIPVGGSTGNTQSGSSGGSLSKSRDSARETPSVDRGTGNEIRNRGIGSTRTPPTPAAPPMIVPKPNDGDSKSSEQDSSVPKRTNPPRRSGNNRNSIQIDRDYNTGRSTLIEVPRHNVPKVGIQNSRNLNTTNQLEQGSKIKRHIGGRRR